jgi:hypothetical protein
MSFLFTGPWGVAWLVSLAIAGLVTLAGRDKTAKRVLAVLVVNFFATRTVVFFELPDILWVINDLVATVALALCGRTVVARASAMLFFIIFQFSLALFLGFASFEPVAAVSDLLGYIILVVMAGAAHDTPRGGFRHFSGIRFRSAGGVHPVALRRSSAPRHTGNS